MTEPTVEWHELIDDKLCSFDVKLGGSCFIIVAKRDRELLARGIIWNGEVTYNDPSMKQPGHIELGMYLLWAKMEARLKGKANG